MKRSIRFNHFKLFVTFIATIFFFVNITSNCFADSCGGGALNTKHSVSITADDDVNNGLKEFFSITGKYYLSVDGVGSMNSKYSIIVEKPSLNSKVKKAFLLTTSTGGSKYRILNTDIKLNNQVVIWDHEVKGVINNYNYISDVTTIIKNKIDKASAGKIHIDIYERITKKIEGTVLVVIFDEPSIKVEQTIVLMFGTQRMEGDSFSIILNDEIDLLSRDIEANMGLGISFGCQGLPNCAKPAQYSTIQVNGNFVTSSAGGQDDGESTDGSLLTVGGVNDSIDNPDDPFEKPSNSCRIDDELYSLLPFLNEGDKKIYVFTKNPSNNDNIFFAYFELPPASIQECDISDTDSDGVIDQWDKCPSTPINSYVNKNGCLQNENSAISGRVLMKGQPMIKGNAMLIQSGEIFQESSLDINGYFKFEKLAEDKSLNIMIRKPVK